MSWAAVVGGAISLGGSMLNRRSGQQAASQDNQQAERVYERQLADMRADQSGPYGGVRWGLDENGRPVRQTYQNQQDADRLQEWRSIAAQRMANAARIKLPEANSFDYSAFMRGGGRPIGNALPRLEQNAAPAAAYNVQPVPGQYQRPLQNSPSGMGAAPEAAPPAPENPMPKAMNRRALGGGYIGG